ncbi:type VI secretion system baseplate subunit TssG [Rhodovulum kholense]|uniref:Type VI secretion system protein ImpH n=1 Tax=Rhodovulum kholense TaxID=453584 RepID=A0A8E3AQT1_9RHOB|nr:type VI secretion system baseplate subunit TssG [Rhodovulum kholense]PTW46575.1 type VI secretion system protein ImpH [Rhodovulum kholense]
MTGESFSDRRAAEATAAEGVGLFAALRALERAAPDAPRIGRNARAAEAVVRLGQDPFLAFPVSDLSRAGRDGRGRPVLRAQFLGFYGAFGALPLAWTEEVRRWFDAGDESFTAFTDIFTERFQELFFRAWSDARPITQFDHPDDRFQGYLLAFAGTATPAFRDRGRVPDTALARLVPLAAGRVKSPVRLRQMLGLHFEGRARVEIEEMVPGWLDFEPGTETRLGLGAASLGRDAHLGARARTISDRIRVHLHVPDMAAFDRFLPGGPDNRELAELCRWYLGETLEIEAALWLPQPKVVPAVLGRSARLGWMACLAPDPDNPDQMVHIARFDLNREHDAPRPAAAAPAAVAA